MVFVRISVASDHAGYGLKESVAEYLREQGFEVIDHGTDSLEPVDFPQFAGPAARDVGSGQADFGILVCGSGMGVCIVANKVAGVRAVNAHDPAEAQIGRRHNNANVLCLNGSRLRDDDALAIVDDFLETGFEGGRHERRVDQISALEH